MEKSLLNHNLSGLNDLAFIVQRKMMACGLAAFMPLFFIMQQCLYRLTHIVNDMICTLDKKKSFSALFLLKEWITNEVI